MEEYSVIEMSAFSIVLYDFLQDNEQPGGSLPSFRLIYGGAVKPRINRESLAKMNLSVQGTDLNPLITAKLFYFWGTKAVLPAGCYGKFIMSKG